MDARRNVSGIVLAGGSGKRMGRDKASLMLGSETLLARTLRVLRSVTGDMIVVGPSSRQHMVLGATVVTDEWPGAGPLGALVTGLGACSADLAFVTACDLPLLRSAVVDYVVDRALSVDVEAVIPVVGGYAQTLHAVYRRSAEPALRRCMEQLPAKRRTLRHAIESLTVRWIDELDLRTVDPDLSSFHNVNTEDEWREFERA